MLGPLPAGLVPGAAERRACNPDEVQAAALERARLIRRVKAAKYAVCHGRPPAVLQKGGLVPIDPEVAFRHGLLQEPF